LAKPPEKDPPLRPGLYIPNLVVDIDDFFQNVLQTVDVSVSLTNWECRPPIDHALDPSLCVAYVELTVTVSSHFLAAWSQSFTFSVRADEKKAERIVSDVSPA
jgi:hypothetical protein